MYTNFIFLLLSTLNKLIIIMLKPDGIVEALQLNIDKG